MQFFLESWLAVRYLSTRARGISISTLFSLLGITIGVAALIVVMAVMNGFREELLSTILKFNGHITVYNYNGIYNYQKIIKKIKKEYNVNSVLPLVKMQAMVMANDHTYGVLVNGITDLSAWQITPKVIAGNKTLDKGVVLGSHLAERLNVHVNDYVTLVSASSFTTVFGNLPQLKTYKVTAIFTSGIFEYDDMFVYMPLQKAQMLFNYANRISDIEIFLKDPEKAVVAKHAIRKEINMPMVTWQEERGSYFNALATERRVMFIILMLIVTVAAFNIISSLTMLVQDKKNAIAIMRTLGMTRASIIRIFIICGAIIACIAVTLGVVIGISLSLELNTIVTWIESITHRAILDPSVYIFAHLPVHLLFSDVFEIISLSLILSLLATVIPAKKAATYDPVQILR